MSEKQRTVHMAEEQKVVLMFGGRKVAEVEFSVVEQSLTFHAYGSTGKCANPVMLSIDTQMLGHTETEE